ncbi:hypothetical protein LA76x_4660 [Lysobacter antibioticus]|uniref:Uncharacterized protein n=1 Tax=Lysobacter antibioticus TaxID=84531 RepID=A0A0S2FGU8_LYSAN|nr:hypothetical protein LA76x_4660 [Lysobacter antibioticus]
MQHDEACPLAQSAAAPTGGSAELSSRDATANRRKNPL